jgi:hypothetical protein
MNNNNCMKLCILMPVYNDMEVAELLVKQLDNVLDSHSTMTYYSHR